MWVKQQDMPKYKEGDLVWLDSRNLQTHQPTVKFAPRQHDPFKVIQVMSSANYCLEPPTQWSIYLVFHINLLTPYKETAMHGVNYQCPPPDLVDREEEKDTQTQTICGLIRMIYLPRIRCGSSNVQTLCPKYT
jgi:hypothetical protein